MKVTALASGWWYGHFWLLLGNLPATNKDVMYWFDTPLEALEFLGAMEGVANERSR